MASPFLHVKENSGKKIWLNLLIGPSFSITKDNELNQVPVTGISKCARVKFGTITNIRIII